MTENDPSASQGGDAPQDAAQRQPAPAPAQEDEKTPPRGTPLGGQQQPNPWSAQAQQQTSGYQWAHPATGPQPSPYGAATTYPAPGIPHQRRRGSGKLVAGVAVLALVVGGGAGWGASYIATQNSSSSSAYNALNQPLPSQTSNTAPAGSVEAVAQKVSPSVVELVVAGSQAQGEGSGFVVSTDGYIVTNNHVVEVAANGGTIQAVFQDGTKVPASIVGRDPTTDIAVVKATGAKNLTPVELGNSDNLKVGQSVVAFGSPFELTGTVTSGIVSALHRPVRAGGSSGDQTTVMSAVQTDAAINPGNSGGPLTNLTGQVIGINSAIYSPQSSGGLGQSEATNAGIGFAIPINQAQRTAQEIIRTGKATQTYIGAGVAEAQPGGALIQRVEAGSPADQAGLKAGDVVTKVDNLIIDDADGLVAAVRTRAPGEKVTLTLSDNRTIQITLGGQPVQVN
ncbi:MAG TPA: trypsin-like peptidase domain-containing protein [Amycolatopsis sp.]|uniref:S1C family serine protease n=1 Tax=Amycolatopsis sp. TaxID=37632 RepID=UPI002B49A6F9|nr:trypsin-like peptidase domain-containing protein [Amycolatopsis sp.]HKS48934.1 trypsin-like peptidase domain-containing protein [Amycolatopsis sp.]